MTDEFCRKVLEVTVAQTCQHLGWNSIHSTPLDIMVDIIHKYLQELSRTTHRYCEQFGRTEPNLDDLGLAFQDIGVSLVELEDYMNNVGPIKRAYEVPKFPIAHKNDIFSYKADSEDQEPELETTIFEIGDEDDLSSQQDSTLHQLLTAPMEGSADESTSTQKRANPDSITTPPQMSKRSRMMTDEELSNMNMARDLTSVFMTSGGLISPVREGKLPDAKTPQYTVPVAHPPIPEGAEGEANLPTGAEQDAATVVTPDDANVKLENKPEVPNESPTKKTGRKKPVCKPKKLNFGGNKSGSAKKDETGGTADKPRKKTPTKASKGQKKGSGKNADASKAALSGITLLAAKNPTESSADGDKNTVNTGLDEVDSIIDAVIQQSNEKDEVIEEKLSQNTSLDETIEDVIQRAMQSHDHFNVDDKQPAKDVYDYSDSATEVQVTPPPPKKEKEKALAAKADEAPPPKPDKKRSGRSRLTKAARKEFVDDLKILPSIPIADNSLSDVEQPTVTSPFHNPPGFPSRPPLPPMHAFHPSFTTNLGPPPPAHQGPSSSPMLLSPRFYPPFPPPMHNLPQFGDLSRLGAAADNSFTTGSKSPSSAQVTGTMPPMQTSPVQVVSIKSEPKSASQSAKIEIKSSMLSPIISESKSSMLLPSAKPEESEPPKKPEKKSKEHKKDRKDKGERKDKSKKKDKKDKVKDENKGQETKEPREKVKSEKKEKSKSKDKKRNKVKDDPPAKDEPLQKITLKFGASSKIYIKPASSPAPPIEEVKSPPTPPPPPREPSPLPLPPSPPPPAPPPPAPPASTKTPSETPVAAPATTSPQETATKSSPPIRGRKKGRPPKNSPKKYATRISAPAVPAAPPPPVEPEEPPTMTLITETVGATLDEDGNKIWICPKCGRPDDGSAMIGCDSCDDWYHWVCVKIVVPPKEEDSWFCTRCISKQQQQLQSRRKKKKHKRDK